MPFWKKTNAPKKRSQLAVADMIFSKKINDTYGHGLGDKSFIPALPIATKSFSARRQDSFCDVIGARKKLSV